MIYRKKIALLTILMFPVITFAETRSDLYEAGASSFNGIEMPLLKSNQLSKVVGDNRINTDIYIGEFHVWNDNIYQKESKDEDEINVTIIGAGLNFTQPDFFDLSFTPQWRKLDYKKNDSDSTFLNLDFSANVKINELMKAGFAIGQNEDNKSLSGTNSPDVESTNKYGNMYIDVTPTDVSSIKVTYGVDSLEYDNAGDKDNEYDGNEFSITPSLKVTERSQLGLEYKQGQRDYDLKTRNDSKWQQTSLVYNNQVTNKINIAGGFGYLNREYGDEESANIKTKSKNYHGLIANTTVGYKLTEKVSLNISGKHYVTDGSTTSNYVIHDRGELGISYSPIAQSILKLSTFTESALESNQKDYKLHGAIFGVTYNVHKYISVGASYKYEKKNSHIVNDDFSNNVVTIGISAAF